MHVTSQNGANIKLSPSALREKLNLSSVYKQAVTKITDTCERHTSASALSSPLMPIYTWLECQWLTDWHTLTDTGFTGSAIGRLYSEQSHVQLWNAFKMGNQNKSETKDKQGADQVVPLDLTHTHTDTDTLAELQICRRYSQSFSVAGDIPWHAPETQSMAVYCGATAGTKGRAGAGIVHQQSGEHHHPHPERLPGQPAHARPKTATSDGHIRRRWSQLLLNKHTKNQTLAPPFFCFSAKIQSAVTPRRPSLYI